MNELYDLIKRSEGCHERMPDGRLKAYKCPAGVWTIGWGSTGTGVTEGTTWTQQQADERMVQEADQCIKEALLLSPILKDKPYKLAAIADFIYNLGASNYSKSTLRKCVNNQDWVGAMSELRKWVNGGGKKLPGLVKRRDAEVELMRR